MILLYCLNSTVSDPTSFKLVSNYTNKAGECYDCYYGEISIPVSGNLEALRIGAFPMKRFTSLCGEVDRAGKISLRNTVVNFPYFFRLFSFCF